MLTDSCPHDTAQLAALRDLAWAKGRTDIVLDLDLHDRMWNFLHRANWTNLVELAALLPVGHLDPSLTERLSRLASTGSTGAELSDIRERLHPWCRLLCDRVSADLEDMSLPRA